MELDTFWAKFVAQFPEYKDAERPEAWQFGVEADELADLVVRGIKTATASGYKLYELEGEALPQPGLLNIILNSKDEPVCVTQNTDLIVKPFDEVTAEFAYLEGEGDRSLDYWRRVHWAFFSEEYARNGLAFSESELVVGEVFECLYAI